MRLRAVRSGGASTFANPCLPIRRRIMRTKTMVQAAILTALGALLGYAAASGSLRTDWFADGADPTKAPSADKPADGPADAPRGGSVVLPRPEEPFGGQIGRTTKDSTKDFPKEVKAPKGAPNVLLILTDDVGFGASSTFGGPVPTPT